VICTVSAALVFTPSLTVSSKVNTSAAAFQATAGAMKVGLLVELDRGMVRVFTLFQTDHRNPGLSQHPRR